MRYVRNHTRSYSMKTIARSLIALTLATSLPLDTFAGDGWHSHRYDDRPRHDSRYRYDGHYRHERRHDRGSEWLGPAIALGVVGLALGAALSEPERPVREVRPVPVYPPAAYAPMPPPPPANAQYYCSSAGRYYPSTPYCPEGWQLVQPPGW